MKWLLVLSFILAFVTEGAAQCWIANCLSCGATDCIQCESGYFRQNGGCQRMSNRNTA